MILESSAKLCELVKINNRIKMVDKDNPIKDNLSPADLPELTLVPTSGQAVTVGTSSSSYGFIQRYNIIISTDEFRTNQERGYNAVMSAVFTALLTSSARIERMPGCGEVKSVLPVEWQVQIANQSNQDNPAPIRGWQCTITVELQAAPARAYFN